MQWPLIILGALLLLSLSVNFILRFIVMPIRMHATFRMSANHELKPALAENLTSEMQAFIGTAVRQFIEEGFEAAAQFDASGRVAGVECVLVFLVNRKTGDVASLIGTMARNGVREMVTTVASEFQDGSRIDTVFKKGIGIFPRDPAVDSVTFSWADDVHALCESHRRRLQRAGRAHHARNLPAPGEEQAWISQREERELPRVAACGYYYLDERTAAYRPTWKGAFFTTWKLCEPIKTWRLRLRDRKARRLWRNLGMERWQAANSTALKPEKLPVPPATGSPQSSAPLQYKVELRPHEVRIRQEEDSTTVWAGLQTRSGLLKSRWQSLLMIILFTAVVSWNSYLLWRIRLWAPYMPIPRQMLIWGALTLFALFVEIWKLARDLRLAGRGATIIVASRAGLSVHNAPRSRTDDEIAREDVAALVVGLSRFSVARKKRLYSIVVRRHSTRRLVHLMLGRDKAIMTSARDALAQAMGIERKATEPAEAASST